jgi:hypothetical protein
MRLKIAAVLVLGLTTIASAQAQTVQANNWSDAVGKTDCKNVHKDQSGTWLLTGIMIVDGRSYGPSLPAEAAELLEKKCGCKPGSLMLLGVGC